MASGCGVCSLASHRPPKSRGTPPPTSSLLPRSAAFLPGCAAPTGSFSAVLFLLLRPLPHVASNCSLLSHRRASSPRIDSIPIPVRSVRSLTSRVAFSRILRLQLPRIFTPVRLYTSPSIANRPIFRSFDDTTASAVPSDSA